MGKTVVVIGGGYGGSLVARELDAEAEVVLIDPRDAFVNVAGSLRALTRPEWAPNVFFPFAGLLERGRVVRDQAVSVDPRGVTLASGARVEADYLVLATGSSYPYPARPAATGTAEALADLRSTHAELAAADRVLITGAGPVGLELAGEIKEVWPAKDVVVLGRGDLLPGLLPGVREDLLRQLDKLGIELRMDGGAAEADIEFRAFGVRVNTEYLADGRLTTLTGQGTVPVGERLNVTGYAHVYALGDITALTDPPMATYAQDHAQVVVRNIRAQLAGQRPTAVYPPATDLRILLPLGTRMGVGQFPTPDGIAALPVETVVRRKGADLFTARFAERFRGNAG